VHPQRAGLSRCYPSLHIITKEIASFDDGHLHFVSGLQYKKVLRITHDKRAHSTTKLWAISSFGANEVYLGADRPASMVPAERAVDWNVRKTPKNTTKLIAPAENEMAISCTRLLSTRSLRC
jgi:hypothetical protein